MNKVDLIKAGANYIGVKAEITEEQVNGFLSHIKIEILFLIIILIILYIPIESLMNGITRTKLGMVWRVVVGLILFFVIRRLDYFKSL